MQLKEILGEEILKIGTIVITPNILLEILIILIATRLLLFLIKKIFSRNIIKKGLDEGMVFAIYSLIKYILWVIAITLILDSLGLKITVLIAGSAALLVGIGLGIQNIFKDILSGVFMLFERNIKIGDVMQLEDGMVGRVKEIGLRTSKILTRDNVVKTIPNSHFVESEVINWSTMDPNTRFHVKVGVAYGSDVRLVEKILLKCAEENKEVSKHPKPFVRFNDFGESSLDFQLFFWTHHSFTVENIKSDLRFAIDDEFRKNQITIPFPQRDIHVKSGKMST